MTEALQAMGSVLFDPYLILLIFLTTILGVIIGVLPGLGAGVLRDAAEAITALK